MKQRARNNRTIRITDEEAGLLKDSLMTAFPEDGICDTIVCNDLMAVIDSVPYESASLIIVDPPYNLPRTFGKLQFKNVTSEKYENYLREWMPKVVSKLKPNGSIYVCGDWKCTASLQRVIEETGLTVLNRITWQREKGRGAMNNWKNGMEDIWFAVKNPNDYYFNIEAVKMKRRVLAPYKENGNPKDWNEDKDGNKFRLTCPSNFWDDISIPFWSMPENTDHPTQKPEKLYAKLILASSRPGDIVFDPFMGSGTACVTAKKLGRHYCGIEINEEYCLWAMKRLQMADENNEIQGYAKGVFWERNTIIKKLTQCQKQEK